jgi:hypothetical protein
VVRVIDVPIWRSITFDGDVRLVPVRQDRSRHIIWKLDHQGLAIVVF